MSNDDRDEGGKFLPGNTVWQGRSTYGRNREYADEESLWTACSEYFEWAHYNPLYEAKILANGDQVPAAKMRAFTQKSLCLYLHISEETWRTWRGTRDDLKSVIQTVDDVIYTQKFEGAAAGLLNANLISRELGLADKNEITGHNGGPIETKELSKFELGRRIAFLLTSAIHEQEDLADSKETK